MFNSMPARWLAVLPVLLSMSVAAQSVPAAGQGEPPNPAAPTAYRSAFEGYQPFSDEKVAPWKESNETVRQIGGWRAYAREAQPAEPAAAPSTDAPKRDPHAGHGKH